VFNYKISSQYGATLVFRVSDLGDSNPTSGVASEKVGGIVYFCKFESTFIFVTAVLFPTLVYRRCVMFSFNELRRSVAGVAANSHSFIRF